MHSSTSIDTHTTVIHAILLPPLQHPSYLTSTLLLFLFCVCVCVCVCVRVCVYKQLHLSEKKVTGRGIGIITQFSEEEMNPEQVRVHLRKRCAAFDFLREMRKRE